MRKIFFFKILPFFLIGIGSILVFLSVLKFAYVDDYGTISGKILGEEQKSLSGQLIKIDEENEVSSDKKGKFFVGSLSPGKHTFYLAESLTYEAQLAEVEIKKGEHKKIVLQRKSHNMPLGGDEQPEEYLLAAADLWAKNRGIVYVLNSAILADMVSPEMAKLAFQIHANGGSDLDKILNIIAFEQNNFTHLDDLVPENPDGTYAENELWGRIEENGSSHRLFVTEIPAVFNAYQNIYGEGKRAALCQGFAVLNAALLRLLGFSHEEVMVVDLWGKLGHTVVLVKTQDGLFMFSNQYLHREKGESVSGKSKLFGQIIEEEEAYVFKERGVNIFANDYYNAYMPEAIINNLDKEKLETWYQNLNQIAGKIPVISKLDNYPKGQEPLISWEKYLQNYEKGEIAQYPVLETKISDYENWVDFYNALKKEIWEKALNYPDDTPYTYAKYNSHSLLVRKPEIYAQASLEGIKLPELGASLQNKEEIMQWIKDNVNKKIYSEPTQIMLADQVIVLSAGRPQDKALLAFSLLKTKNIDSQIVIGKKNSYLFIQGEEVPTPKGVGIPTASVGKIWDMDKLEKIEFIPEEPFLVFNNYNAYWGKEKLPSELASYIKPDPIYFSSQIPVKIGKDFPIWKLSWYWSILGAVFLGTGIMVMLNKRRSIL